MPEDEDEELSFDAGVTGLPPNCPRKGTVLRLLMGPNVGSVRGLKPMVCVLKDVVDVIGALVTGGVVLAVVVVVIVVVVGVVIDVVVDAVEVVVAWSTSILDIVFKSSTSLGTAVVPCVIKTSPDEAISFTFVLKVVVSTAGTDIVCVVAVDVAVVIVVVNVGSVVVAIATVGWTDVDVLMVEDSGSMVVGLVGVGAVEGVVTVGMVVSVVCSGWMIPEPAVPWAVVAVVSWKRVIRFGLSLTRSVSV